MKKLFLLVASILIVLSSCKKESEQWNEKWILYQDSLCKVALDSVLLFSSDSNYVKANGYYKILYWKSSSYSVGEIRNNARFGLWK
ncbi:hypothetical protein [Flavobacterium hercynium]|uniref:Lipoprotein n=1 Tax=Flavobacterium hercynium TaxID=387094 RepID=A0A226GW01_9FLAO|nr:hypothetical protein [Flavobacterium hercynium]OXA85884.1 hypothetical protein B0A66_18675 [Flavobacterium hercynium]SMP33711.1 hypothetical protein SAMN06265346_11721 [Flavobacterium hercynium]